MGGKQTFAAIVKDTHEVTKAAFGARVIASVPNWCSKPFSTFSGTHRRV